MADKAVLRRDDISEFITNLYEGDLHAKRVLSLANATLGVLTSASLTVHAIGQGLAQAMGKLSKHGIKQVDRLLSNEAIDVQRFFGYWVAYMVGARVEIVVALDWTSFARDGHETIVLSMLTGHGRATPLMWKTVQASTLKGNQRRYEDELLRALREAMPAGVFEQNLRRVAQRQTLAGRVDDPTLGQCRTARGSETVPTCAWLPRHTSSHRRSGCLVTTAHRGIEGRVESTFTESPTLQSSTANGTSPSSTSPLTSPTEPFYNNQWSEEIRQANWSHQSLWKRRKSLTGDVV